MRGNPYIKVVRTRRGERDHAGPHAGVRLNPGHRPANHRPVVLRVHAADGTVRPAVLPPETTCPVTAALHKLLRVVWPSREGGSRSCAR